MNNLNLPQKWAPFYIACLTLFLTVRFLGRGISIDPISHDGFNVRLLAKPKSQNGLDHPAKGFELCIGPRPTQYHTH